MKNKLTYILIALFIVSIILVVSLTSKKPSSFIDANEAPSIFPDYTNINIPPNIAPLNFKVQEAGSKFFIEFKGENYKFSILSGSPEINIPIGKWRRLLKSNQGNNISISVAVKDSTDKWLKYEPILNNVSTDSIDPYIVFRHINAGYILWDKMGIYQRNLENFEKTAILLNEETNNNCMHCHTFRENNPNEMMIHLRATPGGTLICKDGKIDLINTKTDYTMSAGVYPSWHPNGNLIAYSVNKISQKFHAFGNEQISVYDTASDIIVYNIEKKEVTTTSKLSTKSLENVPVWSHDGKYLYYINAPEFNENIEEIKYDLLRIQFDEATNTWGETDTLLKASETGKSISFPEISPDGKYMIFVMADYGYFTVHRHSSDLYIMDLTTKEYHKLPVNSDQVESFHSWSSNSKWFLFISKRLDGTYSRVYFSHIDENGEVSKPFLLPQKTTDVYNNLTVNYNRPVFVKDKVKISSYDLSKVAFEQSNAVKFDSSIDINALSGATKINR